MNKEGNINFIKFYKFSVTDICRDVFAYIERSKLVIESVVVE